MMVSVPLAFYNRNDSTEYTDRCEVHNCADDFQTDFVTGIDDFQKCSTLFADGDKCEAYDDCEYKYLKHISVCESCNRVGWDQVFDGVQNAGHLSCLDVGSCHFEFNTLTEMNQPRDDQSCQAGKCCGAQEKDHGAGCDLAGCAGITDAGNTHDNGTEDQWKDHHVQGIHVDASDQTGDSQNRCISSGKKKSGQDTKDQSGKDRLGDMLLVPGIKTTSLYCSLLIKIIKNTKKNYIMSKNVRQQKCFTLIKFAFLLRISG